MYLCAQLGDMWKPPSSWHPKRHIRTVLGAALHYERDWHRAISAIMWRWGGDAQTSIEIPVAELLLYVKNVEQLRYCGPHRSERGKPVPRNAFAAVPVAR